MPGQFSLLLNIYTRKSLQIQNTIRLQTTQREMEEGTSETKEVLPEYTYLVSGKKTRLRFNKEGSQNRLRKFREIRREKSMRAVIRRKLPEARVCGILCSLLRLLQRRRSSFMQAKNASIIICSVRVCSTNNLSPR
uniref:Uncharacterized protein n=1 Tax=Tetraselmis sp. GSL018 TaxID=582737 RepID=A0A061QTY5_9CHLO